MSFYSLNLETSFSKDKTSVVQLEAKSSKELKAGVNNSVAPTKFFLTKQTKTSPKKLQKETILTSHVFKGSLKDTINTVAHLRTILKKQSLEKAIEHFKSLYEGQKYIAYKKHLRGVSHHHGLGPSRRPLKTYLYMIQVLKNFRADVNRLPQSKISRIIVNITNNYHLGGGISKGLGRIYRKDNRRCYLKFYINHQ